MKPVIKLEKIERGNWKVCLGIGNQFFALDYRGTKEECQWIKKMLKKALRNITKQ